MTDARDTPPYEDPMADGDGQQALEEALLAEDDAEDEGASEGRSLAEILEELAPGLDPE